MRFNRRNVRCRQAGSSPPARSRQPFDLLCGAGPG